MIGAVVAAGLALQPCPALDLLLDRAADRAAESDLAEARIAEARSARAEVRSLWRPRLDAYADSQVGDTELTGARVSNQAGLQLSQRLLDWGDANIRARLADARIAESEALAGLDEEGVRQDVAGLLSDITAAQSRIALQAASLTYLERRLSALEALAADGLATRQDIAALRSEVFARQAELEEARLATMRSRELLDVRYGVGTVPCDLFAYRAPQEAVAALASDAPLAGERAAAARVAGADAEAKLQRNARLPIIEATGRLSYASSTFDDNWRLREQGGISLQTPIYAGSAIRARTRQAEARLAQAEAELQLERENARTRTRLLLRARASLARQLVLLGDALAEREKALEATERRLEMGAATIDDLVEARRRTDALALERIEAQARAFEVEVQIATSAI